MVRNYILFALMERRVSELQKPVHYIVFHYYKRIILFTYLFLGYARYLKD